MKEIRLGQILLENRRRRGITQDELAEAVGVSKAAVSKWENAATYPDIALLPKLAAFFNISIDQLMGFDHQKSREEIRGLCKELMREFAARPFEEVMGRCREIVKQNPFCPELLFQIGSLYANHCPLAGAQEKVFAVLEEAAALFHRVKEEAGPGSLANQALSMEGFCLLQLGRGQEVIELLGDSPPLRLSLEPLLSQAYVLTGRPEEAKRILQAGMYQIVVEMLNLQLTYLSLCGDDAFALEETARRILDLSASWHLENLHPGILFSVYYAIAREYAGRKDREKALDLLERYGRLAVSRIYPLRLQGDGYFPLLEGWLEETLPLGRELPREEAMVRKDILKALTVTPEFACLREEPRFQKIIERLQREGEQP